MQISKNNLESRVTALWPRFGGACVVALGIFLAASVEVSCAATPSVSFNIVDLGTFGGDSSRANSINSKGQIVGSAQNASGLNMAFLYENGSMSTFGVAGEATDINDQGWIAGNSDFIPGKGYHTAFIQDGGKVSYYPYAGTGYGSVTGFNNAGQLIGEITINNLSASFLISDGNYTSLPSLGGGATFAYDINDGGDIVGWSATGNGGTHAFLLTNGGMLRDLGTVVDGETSAAHAINNTGQIVGISGFSAFVFEDDSMRLIGGGGTDPMKITNSGLILGNHWVGFAIKPALFLDGQILELQNLIVGNNPFEVLYEALDVNDSGQIVGYGKTADGKSHAFLLNPVTPVPEPVTTVFAGISIFLAGFSRSRKSGRRASRG